MSVEVLTIFNPSVQGSTNSQGSTNDSSDSSSQQQVDALLAKIVRSQQGQNAGGTSNDTDGSDATGSAKPQGTGNLVADGQSALMGDEGKAMQEFNQKDPARFAAFQNALKGGDGNKAAGLLADAVNSGKLSKGDGAAIGAQLQQTANMYGGGRINDDARNKLADAIGVDVLTHGQTAAQVKMQSLFSPLH